MCSTSKSTFTRYYHVSHFFTCRMSTIRWDGTILLSVLNWTDIVMYTRCDVNVFHVTSLAKGHLLFFKCINGNIISFALDLVKSGQSDFIRLQHYNLIYRCRGGARVFWLGRVGEIARQRNSRACAIGCCLGGMCPPLKMGTFWKSAALMTRFGAYFWSHLLTKTCS